MFPGQSKHVVLAYRPVIDNAYGINAVFAEMSHQEVISVFKFLHCYIIHFISDVVDTVSITASVVLLLNLQSPICKL